MTTNFVQPKKIYIWINASLVTSPWIYYNPDERIISISSNWSSWFTIADRNMRASKVFNYWDTLDGANRWWYYQRWNNFPFSPTWWSTSSTKVNASSYWPWNYYYGWTFITANWNYSSWDSSNNVNLRWQTTNTLIARQWPCYWWYHVPTKAELKWLASTFSWRGLWWNDFSKYLKAPFAWSRYYAWSMTWEWTYWHWYSSSWFTNSNGSDSSSLKFQKDWSVTIVDSSYTHNAFNVRAFRNVAVQPDSTWEVLYQPN